MAYFLFVALLLGVAFFSIERWPFSAYPMFSKPIPKRITVLRFKVKFSNGSSKVWQPQKVTLKKALDGELKTILSKYEWNHEKVHKSLASIYNRHVSPSLANEEVSALIIVKDIHPLESPGAVTSVELGEYSLKTLGIDLVR